MYYIKYQWPQDLIFKDSIAIDCGHSLSQQGVRVSSGYPKPQRVTHQDTQTWFSKIQFIICNNKSLGDQIF